MKLIATTKKIMKSTWYNGASNKLETVSQLLEYGTDAEIMTLYKELEAIVEKQSQLEGRPIWLE